MTAHLREFAHAIPTIDKVVASVGATASVMVSHLNDYIGLIVAGLTCMVLIPRMCMGWMDLRERLRVKVEVEVEDEKEE